MWGVEWLGRCVFVRLSSDLILAAFLAWDQPPFTLGFTSHVVWGPTPAVFELLKSMDKQFERSSASQEFLSHLEDESLDLAALASSPGP